jgi:hypothetical protein
MARHTACSESSYWLAERTVVRSCSKPRKLASGRARSRARPDASQGRPILARRHRQAGGRGTQGHGIFPGLSVIPAVDRLLDNGVENGDADSGQDGVPVEAFWESFRLDPRQPGHASIRASDADREIVRAMLADAYADGRITREEYDDRLNILYGSRTLGEIPSLVTDLVPPDGPPTAPTPLPHADLRTRGARKWRRDVEESFVAFLVPSIVCTVIWIAVTSGGFFWPVFPMLFLGLNLVKTVVQRESVIEREVVRLEEQAAKDTAPELPTGRGDPGEAREG